MKVFIEQTEDHSVAIGRIITALKKYAPLKVRFVNKEEEADLVVLHIVGRRQRMEERAKTILENKKRYVVAQYCIRSTKEPNSSAWLALWRGAELVWSYYDLPQIAKDDGYSQFPSNFYRSPLGVDSTIFTPTGATKRFTILTSGRHALTESTKEAVVATQRVGGFVAHLGHDLRRDRVWSFTGLGDGALSELYSQSYYVSGLRRVEGFELPAAEGLMCGARPIMFDQPHYRYWFNKWAIFIPEGDRDEVSNSLEEVFRSKYLPVTVDEIEEAKHLFDWGRIAHGFWSRIIS